jgi:hypothetical protein
MDPKKRVVECLSRYRVTNEAGDSADLERLAESILATLGPRKKIYSCLRQDLEIPCEHEDHEMDIIVLGEG